MRRRPSLILMLLLAAGLSGCAVLDEDSRYITRTLDDNLSPDSDVTKCLLAPVGIPVGLASLVIDGAVINPIVKLPDAFDDARAVFTEVDSTGPAEIIVFPMRIVTWTVIFVGSELGYVCFP